MKLSKTEEQLMEHIWRLEKAFMKDLINQYTDPKPATTNFPLVSKSSYFEGHFRGLLQNFFGNSASQFASFFTRTTDLSETELKELRKVIDQELAKKKNK